MGTRLPVFLYLPVLCLFSVTCLGQQNLSRPLITQPLVESQLTTLKGNTHPLARPQFDVGAAPPDLPMNRMLLVLKRSPEQEHALRTLLDDQQDKASPRYHKWLTPEEFGTQFGPADQDLQTVTGWLQSHSFQVNRVSHGRSVIEFSGTEAQVEEALHTAIHKYAVNGQEHWANASDPQIPTALAPVVAGVQALNNFPPSRYSHIAGVVSRDKSSGQLTSAKPLFTLPSNGCGVQSSDCFGVGPYDFATIYNVAPAWNASPAIDGTGQTIAIVGETDINPQDVTDFRNFFGLPAYGQSGGPKLNIIHDGPAPGILTDGEESEADLDVEWSGAVAKGASVDFVVSESTETTAGVNLSALYIVDNDLAPVMSESYGSCELFLGTAGNQFFSALWQQAAAEGITVMISSGDGGSAGCDNFDVEGPATRGLQVSGFASTPYNVAVGGTDFNDLTNASIYWSTTNDSTTHASALSYIPETTWDDNCTNPVFGALLGLSKDAETNCNNAQLVNAGFVNIVSGSGGKSSCISSDGQHSSTCAGGYSKPSWQNAPGVPADGARDLPDISLFAASGSPSGSFYLLCEADAINPGFSSCNPNDPSTQFLGIGGTSASSPAFAGVMALVNQAHSRQGNANFVLYKLAQKQPSTFHDVTAGTISVPCQSGSPNCTVSHAGDQFGILAGYNAKVGYDLATGIGSVDVDSLLSNWTSAQFTATTTTLNLSPTSSLTHGQSVTVTGGVAPTSGSGVPTGAVSLITSTGIGVDGFRVSNGAISGHTNLLPGGTYTVTAHYGGDANFGGSDSSPVSITVGKENSSTQLSLVTFDWNGREISSNASTAVYGSPYIFRVNVLNSAGAVCSPNPLGEAGCPTGTVNLTDNGSALDGGAFKLNSLGYTEDQSIQLSGGSNAVMASYAGDNSFNPSSASTTFSVTAAPTTSDGLGCCPTLSVGSSFFAVWTINSQSSGAPPTGTVTYYANGIPLSGNTQYSPFSSPGATPSVSLETIFNSSTSAFSAPGTYSITANYSGDANYQPTTAGTTVHVTFPTPTMNLQSSSSSVSAGTDTTLTVTVLGDSTTIAPTGTISFYGTFAGQISGSISYATVTDPNTGKLDLQGTLTRTPAVTENYYASYSGDTNYPACQSCANTSVTVQGDDFAMNIPFNSATVTPGEGAAYTVNVGFETNTAPISLACTGLPKETTCNMPGPVSSAGGIYFTVATTAPHSALAFKSVKHPGYLWLSSVSPFLAILLVGAPRSRPWRLTLSMILIGVVIMAVGCGGSGSTSGGGGGGPSDLGTPAGTYNITVTGTSGSGNAAITHATTFNLVVQ
jgi:pro-kumamolisin-like protein/Big-like domain-containing protein